MSAEILVIMEHWQGQVEPVSYQLLTKGAELAEVLGADLSALVLGSNLADTVAALGDKGMDRLIVIDDPALAQVGADVQAAVIAAVVRQREPAVVLVGYTLPGMELAPALAVHLAVPVMTNCVNLEVLDGHFVVTRPLFDGTCHAKIALEAGPAVVAIQRGATPTMQLTAKRTAVEPFSIDASAIPLCSQVLDLIEEPAGEVDITKAKLLVAIGRGIGDKEKLPIIETLAQALGGLVACSRPLVDLGFLPRDRQVGASGKVVAPRVYLACGISGASQHLSGMSDAGLIIAINKDPQAPIYQVAHCGVVADLFSIVPALTEKAEEIKNKGA